MGAVFTWANLGIALVLEIAALGALGYAASKVGDTTAIRVALAVGVPLVAAILWGIFAAPQAPVQLPLVTFAVKALVFGGAAVGLAASGHRTLGVVFLSVVVVNAIALHLSPPVAMAALAAASSSVVTPEG